MSRTRSFDFLLLGTVVAIAILGLAVLASATKGVIPGRPHYFIDQQAAYLLLGIIGMIILSRFDYTRFRRYGTTAYVIGVVLLLVVFVHGHSALGATRWIRVGPFHLQPSEFMKVFLVLGLAKEIGDRRGRLANLRDLLPLLFYAAIPIALVIKEPDLGTAIVLIGILIAMLYVGGARGWHLLLIFGGGIVLIGAWIWLHMQFGIPIPMHSYQLKRLIVFLNPKIDPLGSGYNILQSQISIGSGGLLGQGLAGNAGILSFLPARYTDFIFAVVGLDFGLLGAGVLLLLYIVLVMRMLTTAAEAKDLYGNLLGTGATAMILVHVLMNAGMVMGVTPVVGVPLPLVSYGGSAVISDCIAFGLVMALRRRVRLPFGGSQSLEM